MRKLVLLALSAFTLVAQTAEEKEILAIVQKAFDGIAARDAALIRTTLLPDARIYSVAGENPPRASTGEAFAGSISAGKGTLLEKFIGTPTVSIRGRMAQVWGEYEFFREGKFTHCGVDTLTLFKTVDGWRIASLMYTVEPTGCKGR